MTVKLKSKLLNSTHIQITKLLNNTKVIGNLGIMTTDEQGNSVFQSQYGNAVVKITKLNTTLNKIKTALTQEVI